jgi:hypothetical protein
MFIVLDSEGHPLKDCFDSVERAQQLGVERELLIRGRSPG